MPEKALKKLNTYISPQQKACFLAALLVGLIAHLYKITNWLPNWDSLVFRYDSQNMMGLGRWFLPVVTSFSSFYDLPFLNGILAIAFHGLGAVCICKMFNIQKTITACLIGAVIVSFPTVTSVMMYNYVADGYAIAFLLSTLAALYMTQEKSKYVFAAILIALSAGIYQAYITVTVMLVLLYLIDEVIYRGASFGTVLKKGVYMLLAGIVGMVLYSIILKVILGIFSVELLDYQGANASASLSNINLLKSLYIVKETFMICFFDVSDGVNLYVVLNAFVLVFTLVYSIKNIIKNKVYQKPLNIIALVILGTMLVMGAGVLAFVNAEVDYHNLMRMGYVVFYLFFLMLYERGSDKKGNNIKCWAVLIVAVMMISNQIAISNVSYHKAQMAYEKSYGVLIRIADRIEQTPNAENCDRILVVGALENSEDYSVNLTPDITGITDGYIIRADDETVGQSVFCAAINDYCEKDYDFVYGKEKQKLMEKEEVRTLEQWPSKDCITVIDNTIVIKLGTEGEN